MAIYKEAVEKGKKEGFKDKTRGTLFFDVADIIDRTRPKAFLLENVEGIITHDKGRTFNTIVDTLVNDLEYHMIGVEEGIGGYLEKIKSIYDGI